MRALPFAVAAGLALAVACGGGDDSEPLASLEASRVRSASPTRTPTRAVTATPTATAQPTPAATESAPPATDTPAPTEQITAPPANSSPFFPSSNVVQEETNFEYDDDGNLVGAVTTLTVTAASDPDGDPLTYNWTATTGSISGNGLSAVWTRAIEFGDVAPGTVTVTASDGRGGMAQFIIEYL